jgi:hypothetical protein
MFCPSSTFRVWFRSLILRSIVFGFVFFCCHFLFQPTLSSDQNVNVTNHRTFVQIRFYYIDENVTVNGESARINGSCEKEDENESFCCADRPRQMEKQQLCNYRCSTSTYICRTIQSKPTDFSCLDYTRYFGPLYQVMF